MSKACIETKEFQPQDRIGSDTGTAKNTPRHAGVGPRPPGQCKAERMLMAGAEHSEGSQPTVVKAPLWPRCSTGLVFQAGKHHCKELTAPLSPSKPHPPLSPPTCVDARQVRWAGLVWV
jgi:hypothetical protein